MNFFSILLAAGFVIAELMVGAPEPTNKTETGNEAKPAPVNGSSKKQEARFRLFEKTLGGVMLRGHFTIIGSGDRPPAQEEYSIHSVKKLPQGDYWLFAARVKYGKKDLTLPLPLPVKWAGDTPVISLDNLTLPGLGTFSAHVVIDGDKYAGTWTHGQASGHMFGSIEPLKPEKKTD